MKEDLRIVFMGTPDFAVASLDILVRKDYNIVGVITAPDRPAGRGQQLQQSAVKQYAVEKGLKILQPEKLKAPEFLDELRALKADLQIVVAFRMLPEAVWAMPPRGTFNLHGSLLPQYRGAAPINRAVMNGETETGVTTFFLQHEIDTGRILFSERCDIGPDENAGEIHDRLMQIGAELVLKTVQAIIDNNYTEKEQDTMIKGELKHAPKIFREDCEIRWSAPAKNVHDHIRGLSPYPAAFTTLVAPDGKETIVKIFRSTIDQACTVAPGTISSDGKTFLKVAAEGSWLNILELQLAGKKRLSTIELLRGFQLGNGWKMK
jgi:methionyl-tRNA formyltransferase